MAENVEYISEEEYLRQMQGQPAPQMPMNPGAGAYQAPQDRYGSSIIELTDPKDDLNKFELFLMSMKRLRNGKMMQIGDPLLNAKGRNSVMASIESLVHRTNTLSNFDKILVEHFIVGLSDTLSKDLMLNRLTYEVERKNRDIIVDNAVRFAHSFVMRAFEEGDKKFWKGSMQEVKHTQEITKAGGGLGGMNPFNMFKKH